MFLDKATKSFELLLDEAKTTSELEIIAYYDDEIIERKPPTTFEVKSNGVTAVTIVPAPKDNTKRTVREITVYNADTVAHGVVVRLNDSVAGIFRCLNVAIPAGGTYQYTELAGWILLGSISGSVIFALQQSSNLIIDGDFRINQRGYVSGATLAAGVYGHDRWKAGASGGNYSFTQLASPTTITIAANKSLIQVVEDKNVVGGSYTLSWPGTAVARVGINSATPSGNFAVSPIVITGQAAGTAMSVEYTGANAVGGSSLATNSGTLGTIKLEAGSVATPFVPDDYAVSLARCRRYCLRMDSSDALNGFTVFGMGYALSTTRVDFWIPFGLRMRTRPSVTFASISLFEIDQNTTTLLLSSITQAGLYPHGCEVSTIVSGATAITPYVLNSANTFSAYIIWDAEL